MLLKLQHRWFNGFNYILKLCRSLVMNHLLFCIFLNMQDCLGPHCHTATSAHSLKLEWNYSMTPCSSLLHQEGLYRWQLMSVLLQVRASCFTLPLILLHTCMETYTHFFICSFSGYIIFTNTHTPTHTCIQMWNLKLFPLSFWKGYLCDTSSHPSLWLISSHHTHLCTGTC